MYFPEETVLMDLSAMDWRRRRFDRQILRISFDKIQVHLIVRYTITHLEVKQ